MATASSHDARCEDLRRALGACSDDLRRLRRSRTNQRHLEQKRKRDHGFTSCEKLVALFVFILSSHNARVAALFLSRRRCRRQQAAQDPVDFPSVVEGWYLAAPMEEIVSAHYPDTLRQRTGHKAACAFVAEQAAVDFVAGRNEVGVAPTPAEACHAFRERLAVLRGLDEEARQAILQSPRSQRKFAKSLRVKWKLGFRALPLRPDLSEDAVRSKAPAPERGYFRAHALRCL